VKKDRNLNYLKNRFYERGGAAAAIRVIEKTRPQKLWHLLRHHNEEPVLGQEVTLRDAVDDLLSFYGVVEVASCIDFVPSVLPQAFQEEALRVLSEPAVRRYYEWNYPLPIVNRFRERLLGWTIARDRSGGVDKISLFYRFLSLLEMIESDDRVTAFLWLLDSGEEGGYEIDDVLYVLSSPKRFISSTSRSPQRQTKLDKAVIGFSRFLNICVEYYNLLRDAAEVPVFAESIWAHQAYWFYRLHEDFGKDLERSIKLTNRWTKSKADKRKIKSRTKELLSIMAILRQPPSGMKTGDQLRKHFANTRKKGQQNVVISTTKAPMNLKRPTVIV